jgi:salicylate hydroxylase
LVTSTTQLPVLIVGGGIGGLSAALALSQAGHQVHVAEQAPEFVEVGAGVQLAPNATRALARLGVLEQVEQHAVRPNRLVMMDAVDGAQLTELDVGAEFRARYGAPYIVLHRHDLLSELLAACRADDAITLETNKRVSAVQPRPDGAEVECADGTHYVCDALIGADGLRSSVRRLIADDEPLCSQFVAYRGPVPIERVPVAVQMDTVVVWVGPDLHLVQYPLRRGEIFNQVAVFHSDRYTDDRRDDWGTAEELVEHFDAMCPPVANSIGLLDQSVRWPMYDRLPIDNWTRGAVTLLGDAAHPMLQYLAQGACQALEDAVQLGADFTPGRDPGEAFLAYQAERIPRTARVQRSARSWGELWHLDGVGRQVRNRFLGQREAADYSETDWLYGANVPLEPAMTITNGEAPR